MNNFKDYIEAEKERSQTDTDSKQVKKELNKKQNIYFKIERIQHRVS